ncbi:MAG: CoA transferase, partial [Gammaproteobacteria bacterium]|nr:CoA transferase [Gammaproteobacteria bacterium]
TLSPQHVRKLAEMLDEYGMAADLHDPKYADAQTVQDNALHIIEEVVAAFIASVSAEEAYHAAQARGFTWGAVRPAEALLDDPHLADRGFWKTVAHPELGRSVVYPGEAAIFSDSPWAISRRAPLLGEHNVEILCGELGLAREALGVLAENRVI